MEFISEFLIDFIFIIIIALSVIFAVRKGFLKSLLSLICVILALVIASLLNAPAAEWCYDSFISDSVVESVEDNIPEVVDEFELASVVESMPEFVITQLEKMDIDIEETFDDISAKQPSSHEIAEEIADEIISPAVIMLLRIVFYLIIFIVIRFLLGLVSKLICKLDKLPVVKQFNKGLGGLIGLGKGVFIVFSLAVVLNFISQLLNNNDVLAQAIENSFICDIIGNIIK